MRKISVWRLSVILGLLLCLCGWLAAAQEKAPPVGGPAPEALASPADLPRLLALKGALLEKKISALEPQVAASRDELRQTEKALGDLRITVATWTASLALLTPPSSKVEEVVTSYEQLRTQVEDRLKKLTQEISGLGKEQVADAAAQNILAEQVKILQAVKPPPPWLPEINRAYQDFGRLAEAQNDLVAQIQVHRQGTLHLLEQEQELLAGLQPQIKALEETWKAELLQRQAHLSALEQLRRIWQTSAALPGRLQVRLVGLLESGQLAAFFQAQVAHLIGLAALLILFIWGARRLKAAALQRFRAWQAEVENPALRAFLALGQALVANLLGAALILWVALLFWTLGLVDTGVSLLGLNALWALLALWVGEEVVQAFFAGKDKGGVLPLGPVTSRFYRRSLKFFVAYLAVFAWVLASAEPLGFSPLSRHFLGHLFRLGLLAWVLWLLRRRYLSRLLPELPGPAWARQTATMHLFRGLALLFLLISIISDLLGFRVLAFFVAQAAAWTGLALISFWFLYLVAASLLDCLFHPETGWAIRRYPDQVELVQKVYGFSRRAAAVLLAAGVILVSLNFWGIRPELLALAFAWVTWGPTLGPLKLTLLNVAAAVLALYLGSWFSRLLRSALRLRVFPRTGWDAGVQYTISATLHYAILILTIMIALNLLGFPLTNLALVAGALGVGIGFGLQNIVNNFISGLILLFERPIKVGDLLVIDGQWGIVKEIRVRSTIFETFDRYVLVIPNSELISSKVLNWTHYGRGINRLTLKVGVGYGSDVKQVTKLINEICRANPRVFKEPPPQIYFSAYGESSLDFIIWVYVKTPDDRVPATHELNSAIFEAFQQAGIEIPFPQRDLFIKNWPQGLAKEEGRD